MHDVAAPVADAGIDRIRIARAFGDAAPHYDEYAALQREVARELCGMVVPRKVDTMLDLGCGTGYCGVSMRDQYPLATLVGLDLAQAMLQQSRVLHPDLLPVCADAACLPFADATFDLVCSSLALQWCASPHLVFAELQRVLRPGGQALLSTFGPYSLAELRQAWAAVDSHVHVNEFMPVEAIESALSASGLRWALESRPRVCWYPNLRALARELKGIGAHNMNAAQRPGLTGRRAFAEAERAFAAQSHDVRGVPVTYEVLYLTLEKPA